MLAEIKGRLARNRTTAPLFDTPRFCRNMERAYKAMWDVYAAGEAPKMLIIKED